MHCHGLQTAFERAWSLRRELDWKRKGYHTPQSRRTDACFSDWTRTRTGRRHPTSKECPGCCSYHKVDVLLCAIWMTSSRGRNWELSLLGPNGTNLSNGRPGNGALVRQLNKIWLGRLANDENASDDESASILTSTDCLVTTVA